MFLVIFSFVLLTIIVFPVWFFVIVAISIIVLGLYEFYSLIQKKGILIFKYVGILIGIIIPLTIYFEFRVTRGWELLFMMAACLCVFILQFLRRESEQAIIGVSTTIFGILYVSWFFSFIIKSRLLPNGAHMVLFLVLVAKLGDVGAYLIGSRFGRHALIPRISPKKSVEGAIGGLFCSLITALLCQRLLPGVAFGHFVILGAFLGILGQVGDLSESLIKRDCQVKDSSSIFGLLGGMLDIIDSILFTAPVFYFYVKFLL